MYHTASTRRRPSSPLPRVWSHNTGYTGVAGIHSEVGSGAHARNHRTQRKSSTAMIAEEDLMKKEMRAMEVSRKSLENSMLLYSQKMRDISQRKYADSKSTSQSSSAKKTVDHTNQHVQDITMKNDITLPPITVLPYRENSNELDKSKNNDSYPTIHATTNPILKPESRMSIDSGISLDSHRDSLISYDSNKNGSIDTCILNKPIPEGIESNKVIVNGDQEKTVHNNRGRLQHRKRFCDSKTSKFIGAVPIPENDIQENKEVTDTTEEEFETPRIAPFPYDLYNDDPSISPLVLAYIMECDEQLQEENQVAGPIGSRKKGDLKGGRVKERTPYVLFKPKPAMSPSLAALRYRFLRRFGPNSVYFSYSEEVLSALRSLSNSPNRQKSGRSHRSNSPPSKIYRSISPSKTSENSYSSSASSPTLHGVDFEDILRAYSTRTGGLARLLEEEEYDDFFITKEFPKRPQFSRERSFSAPSSKGTQRSFVSRLEQVEENDDSKLKPVLKKDTSPYSSEKKNVQFFLPDVFKRANGCTSQSQGFR